MLLESHLVLLIGIIFVLVFGFGRLFDKMHIPGIFMALLLGIAGSSIPFVQESLQYDGFKILSFLAMNFLLFLIGFEIDLKKIKELGKFIVKSSFFIILSEAVALGLLVHFFFHQPLLVSALIGLSFATVGEAILIPILDSLKVTKTKLGQSILGVATMDDIFEIFSVIVVAAFLPMLIGSGGVDFSVHNIVLPLGILAVIVGLGLGMIFGIKRMKSFRVYLTKYKFFFCMVVFFIFLGLGAIGDMASIGAIMGGIVASEIVKKADLDVIEKQVKNIAFYFLGPIFFFYIGTDIDLESFTSYWPLILVFSIVPYLIKILVSYLNGRKVLGTKQSIYMGVALGVRFSTSIVILTLFLQKGIIGEELFSVLISTTITLKFVIPVLLSWLARKWGITTVEDSKI